ncbi:urease, alpha subunit [Clostridium thermobutyricum]|uniref:Urease subunit alpha n=1 Tax=Clostridium thermobutyricum TaxID=29372 RepID=N9XUA7_9CLOT|nr:urease subunit alpha [Clostridium thermobutyricum]ENZ03273.1 urease, alpha subunit [Clostridium thermobutyricum]
MSFEIDRKRYSDLFGPTAGDKIRLGDTDLFIEIEKDLTVYGDECKFGGGKSLREGMGENSIETRKNPKVVDLIITGVTILDYTGIYKADIGIKDGKILAIGKGGNPLGMDDVDFIVGVSTEALAGEGLILTAGGIDTHVHYISPDLVRVALEGGITTVVGGGTGPNDGTNATTCTPGAWNIERMIESAEGLPINIGFLGKGSGANVEVNGEQIEAGACGLKVHEDWGATKSAIDYSLRAADKYDVQVSIHTDTLNEAGFVEDTIDAIQGRVIHTFHTEGAGGGHAPDILKMASYPNVLPASTNPTKPYTKNTIAEHLDMLMVCHHLDAKVPEDIAFADSRIRKQTIAAEDILHDMGIFSMMSSDTMAMGRIGEVVTRTWQTASKMKVQRGTMENDKAHSDNNRVKRYVAKYTINPAIAQGISEYVGSVEEGKVADLVLYEPAFFGVKPKIVIKGGMIINSIMGEANASIPTCQPELPRAMFGAYGKAMSNTCITFVSQYAYEHGIKEKLGLQKEVLPVKGIRNLTKKDMKLNGEMPKLEVDPQTYDVKINGELATCEPAETLPLTQRYFLF